MKSLWSAIIKTHYFHLGRYLAIPIKLVHIFLIIVSFIVLLLLNIYSSTESSATSKQKDSALKQQQIAEIEDSINNSHARSAADHVDICPKMLQKKVGDTAIERVGEVMVDDYCDYFFYPHSGDSISTKVSDSQIEVLLIVPDIHNFADGDYVVDSYDKHVIRLSYNGTEYPPKQLKYDFTVMIKN